MNCECGASYGDLHAPGCQYVADLCRAIQRGDAAIRSCEPPGELPDCHLLSVEIHVQEPGWLKTHGLLPGGVTPNHQPECHDFK